LGCVAKIRFVCFFAIGLLCQFMGVSHWDFYYWGWLDSYSGYYHAFVQIQLYEKAFVVGFLGMALPRFWESVGPRGGEVVAGLALLILELLAALLEQWTLARVAYFFCCCYSPPFLFSVFCGARTICLPSFRSLP
jgi:hypothetical protein